MNEIYSFYCFTQFEFFRALGLDRDGLALLIVGT